MDVSANFYAELYSTPSDTDTDPVDDHTNMGRCLISHELLTDHAVTLECGHSFNYISLYNHALHSKYKSGPYASKIGYSCIICPYCRHIHPKLMPYLTLDGISPVYGVNSLLLYKPRDFCCMHSNKRNGSVCHNTILKNYHPTGQYYCYKHRVNIRSCLKEPISSIPIVLEPTTDVPVSESTGLCVYVFKKGVKKGECCQIALKSGNPTQYCSKHSHTTSVVP